VIERLRELYEACLCASRFNDAMFISVLLTDAALSLRVMQTSKRWAAATALSTTAGSNSTNEGGTNEGGMNAQQCLEQWNAVLRAERHGISMAAAD
jgi:hypothetical protein